MFFTFCHALKNFVHFPDSFQLIVFLQNFGLNWNWFETTLKFSLKLCFFFNDNALFRVKSLVLNSKVEFIFCVNLNGICVTIGNCFKTDYIYDKMKWIGSFYSGYKYLGIFTQLVCHFHCILLYLALSLYAFVCNLKTDLRISTWFNLFQPALFICDHKESLVSLFFVFIFEA